jgi:hypothetical protein
MFEDELAIFKRHSNEHICCLKKDSSECDVLILFKKLGAVRDLYLQQRELAIERGKENDILRKKINCFDTEYFCTNCLQLRLTYKKHPVMCVNCCSGHIIYGPKGLLDKKKLKVKYDRASKE